MKEFWLDVFVYILCAILITSLYFVSRPLYANIINCHYNSDTKSVECHQNTENRGDN